MIRLRKMAREVEAKPKTSLADRIRETCAEAEALIESRVDVLKNSEEGKLLPRGWLSADLRRRHGGNCACRVALSLLEEESNGQ